ncbi:uncharacterized protein TNCV_4638751 [Trichonephila clavipes]|uniref:Uncharacterized protein n=1 Tax=Trichonephila clavipes TaxID=2585209 RepID=A0A8X6WDD8_TRICX|nr:uncharacterized protein TNCV_4638751 [Trichonephila clavipes]
MENVRIPLPPERQVSPLIFYKLGYLSITEKIPRLGIRAHYEQLSEFERGHIIELKKAGWANRGIVRHMGRRDAVIRRFWQEWMESGRFQRHDGSG